MTCSSFSTGGSFLACGASDNFIHIYGFHPDLGPYWIDELLRHSDKVDSVQFCNLGFRFISGSKDGTAIIWTYKLARWEPLVLDMDTQLNQQIVRTHRSKKPPMVLIVQWSRDDRYVMTSLVDYSIKVWDSKTGKLVYILREHKHDIYLIESHPTDPRIFVSAGHDGRVCIWDITTGRCIKKIINVSDHRRSPEQLNLTCIYDIKFSPDGNMLAATDSHGNLRIFSNGGGDIYKHIPDEMFFSTDYKPLIRDVHHFVMDENTHVAPHLMPRPLLVDMAGLPYPNSFQRLVPDHQCGQQNVIPPLSPNQLKSIASVIENHSKYEDEEYIAEKHVLACYGDYDSDATIIDSDATVIDSDATEIDEENAYCDFTQQISYPHNLRSRSYGRVRVPERRRYCTRLRSNNKRIRR